MTHGDTFEQSEGVEAAVVEAWQDVPRIPGRGRLPRTKEELLTLVEEPLKEACGMLYDFNIQTLSSGCNMIDYQNGYGGISISWTNLSLYNRQVARELPFKKIEEVPAEDVEDELTIVHISIPISKSDFPDMISRRALKLAQRFKPQPMVWAPKANFEEFQETAVIMGNDLWGASDDELREAAQKCGYYVDGENVLWLSEEHWRKATRPFN